ncbi:hypothetical protein HGB47_14860 [Leptospira yasudae]|uniref:hypothetical protein n=1 Tax=Leptospira yasudae TaxID=2202201 RepID=UPI001C4EC32D|nr:hypothetical protein [Leptospira yasudae]MBW0434897.1 hypothetical protein [Leptospira yasudae]
MSNLNYQYLLYLIVALIIIPIGYLLLKFLYSKFSNALIKEILENPSHRSVSEELKNSVLEGEETISALNYSYDQISSVIQNEYNRYIQQYKINKNARLLLGYYHLIFLHFFRLITVFNKAKNKFKRIEEVSFSELRGSMVKILRDLKLDFPSFMKNLRSVHFYNRSLLNNNTTFENILIEKLYLDTYTNLEVYLQNIVATLLSFFPVYLNKTELKLKVNNIFGDDFKNIHDLKSFIIEEDIVSIFHSKNISDVVVAILKKFKIEYRDEYGESLNKLFFYSKIRNHIIHSTGVVNKKFLTDLSLREIKHNLVEGESLKILLKSEIEIFADISYNIMQTTNSLIVQDLNRMYMHNKSSNKNDA